MHVGWFVCLRTLTVSKGCPSSVTVMPPQVPANTSLADLIIVFCSSLCIGTASPAECAVNRAGTRVLPTPRSAVVACIPGASSIERKLLRGGGGGEGGREEGRVQSALIYCKPMLIL